MGYRTPKGLDERIVKDVQEDVADRLDKIGAHYINWNGFKVLEGGNAGQFSTFFLDQVSEKRTKEESLILICTAMPGKGKSYFCIRFAEILDPKFDPDLQIVFRREDFLFLVGDDSPLVRGQVIIFDESHFGMGARSWYEEIQKMLMNNIAALRSKGLIVIIVALHLEQMDKVIRKFVLSYMIHMERRGLATVYSLYTTRFDADVHKNRLGQMSLRLPGVEGCPAPSCLSCEYSGVVQKDWRNRDKWTEQEYKPCKSIRAKYERNKKTFIGEETLKAQEAIKQKELRDNPVDEKDYADMIMEKYKDRLSFNSQKNPKRAAIRGILKLMGHRVGGTKLADISDALMFHYKVELEELRLAQEASKTT